MADDAMGNLYFADALAGEVFQLDSKGNVTRIAGNSRTDSSGDSGPAVNASLNSPRGYMQ
jgi:hypothetical protein